MSRIPSGVASPVTTNHAAKGSVSVNLRNGGNFKNRGNDLDLAKLESSRVDRTSRGIDGSVWPRKTAILEKSRGEGR